MRTRRLPAVVLAALLALPAGTGATTVYKYRDANGVPTFTDQAVRGAERIVYRDRMVEQLDAQVRLERRPLGAGQALWLHNDLYAPVEVELRLEGLSNVARAPAGPIRTVLPARSRHSLFALQPADPARPVGFEPRLRYALGDPRAAPSPRPYPLPWRGGPFTVSQGANGSFSHYTPKSRHAIDVAMPEGTPIVASRGGIVVKTENGQDGRGANPSGNFVRVLHDDGTMGVYLHLARGSVAVREGQRIGGGAPIGRSGNTGNSTGPHLHFVVQRNVGMALESIPFRFAEPLLTSARRAP